MMATTLTNYQPQNESKDSTQWWTSQQGQALTETLQEAIGHELAPQNFENALQFFGAVLKAGGNENIQRLDSERQQMIQDLVEKFRQDAADQERKELEIQHCFGQVELALSRVKAEANLKNSELQNQLRGKEDALTLKIQGIKNQTNLSEQDFRQLIDLQQKKITNLTDTILAVKSKITEFEFKLENFSGEKFFTSEFIGDYRNFKNDIENKLEQQMDLVSTTTTNIIKATRTAITKEIKLEIIKDLTSLVESATENAIKDKKFKKALGKDLSGDDVAVVVEKKIVEQLGGTNARLSKIEGKLALWDEMQTNKMEVVKLSLENKTRDIIATGKIEAERVKKLCEEEHSRNTSILKALKEGHQKFEDLKDTAIDTFTKEMEHWRETEEVKMIDFRETIKEEMKSSLEQWKQSTIESGRSEFMNSVEYKRQEELIHGVIDTLNGLKASVHQLTSDIRRKGDRQKQPQLEDLCRKCKAEGYDRSFRKCTRHNFKARKQSSFQSKPPQQERSFKNRDPRPYPRQSRHNPPRDEYYQKRSQQQPNSFLSNSYRPYQNDFYPSNMHFNIPSTNNTPQYVYTGQPHFFGPVPTGRPWVM